jgi:hypothetical protein
MKNKLLNTILALLFLPALSLAQGVQGNVRQNGNNVSVAGQSTNGSLSLVTNDTVRLLLDSTGGAFATTSNPATGTAPNGILTGGTIDSTIFRQRITTAGAVTGVILEDGTASGQIVLIQLDKDAAGSVTFAAEATSNVCSGTSAVLAAGEGAMFVYDATDTCWTEFGT